MTLCPYKCILLFYFFYIERSPFMVRTIHKITAVALSASLVLSGAFLSGNSAKAAKKLSISKTSISLKKGNSKTLKIKNLKKGRTVTWKSSKPSVAKVTKTGKVTAKKTGTAVITAKQTFQCKVTVKKMKSSNKKLSISKTSISLKKGNSKTFF